MKGLLSRSIVALLLLASVLMPILTFFVGADSKYDYSSPSANFVKEIYPDDFLLEHVTGVTLTDEERAFLREEWGALIRFNSSIPTYAVSTEYRDGGIDVTAEKYDYVAENGTIVVWKPYKAELCGSVVAFDTAPYVARFDNVGENETERLAVS